MEILKWHSEQGKVVSIKCENIYFVMIMELTKDIEGWIYRLQMQSVNIRNQRVKGMASTFGNGVDKYLDKKMIALKEDIIEMITKISEHIITEAHSHFVLVTNQLGSLKKYVENMQAIVDLILPNWKT